MFGSNQTVNITEKDKLKPCSGCRLCPLDCAGLRGEDWLKQKGWDISDTVKWFCSFGGNRLRHLNLDRPLRATWCRESYYCICDLKEG